MHTPYNQWSVIIRNRQGLVATATFMTEITALHFCIDWISHYSSRRKHLSCFVTGSASGENYPVTSYEYHG